MPKVNMEMMLPFIEEAFNRGADFQIPITGTSMNPLLYQNRDFVKISKPYFPLKVGDIPLYRRGNGAFVLHRVVGIKENGEYIMCGDNQFLLEYGITDANIIGIATTLVIDGKEIDVQTDYEYLKHKKKYVANVGYRYPWRRLRYKLHSIKERLLSGKSEAPPAKGEPQIISQQEKEKINNEILEVGALLISVINANLKNENFEFDKAVDFKKLYTLAQNHRVTALVAPSVLKCEFADSQIKGAFSKELFKTAARYTAQKKECDLLSEKLSELQIPHCFLKGTKVSAYYDNPDARFMLDMDLFVQNDKFYEAEKLLISQGYEMNSAADDKDVGYIKKPFLIIELHRELKYDYDKGYEYYKGAFERMTSENGYTMNMTDEDFYVYILSHTAHHFGVAGTGIKSIVDHYFLKEKLKPKCDSKILEESLEKIGLTKFNNRMDVLCDFWFKNAEGDSLTPEIANYVILSGVFGNITNSYLNSVVTGRCGENSNQYLFQRLFPSLKTMKIRYNILNKFPILLPCFWVVRILTSFFDRERISREAKVAITLDDGQKEIQKQFFNNMGLD